MATLVSANVSLCVQHRLASLIEQSLIVSIDKVVHGAFHISCIAGNFDKMRDKWADKYEKFPGWKSGHKTWTERRHHSWTNGAK